MPPQQPPNQGEPVDPANSFIQSMLVISLLACLGTITMIVIELNQHYDVTFGGMLEAPGEAKIKKKKKPKGDMENKDKAPGTKSKSKDKTKSSGSGSSSESGQ